MAEIYKRFAEDCPQADFSEEAAIAMYKHENGVSLPETKTINGFALGKKWMSITVAMWKDDIAKGLLLVNELLDDGYPEWFLKNIGVYKYRLLK